MRIAQQVWSATAGWMPETASALPDAQLVLVFGGTTSVQDPSAMSALRKGFPRALLFGCSTAGEICDTSVSDDSIVATAVEFERTTLRSASARIVTPDDSHRVGQSLAGAIPTKDSGTCSCSDGLRVNGSALFVGSRPGCLRASR
jgi:hypothetical protein